jgi:hypothetical protein
VLIAYGVSDAFFSFTFGYAVKYAGRQPIFILGAIINAGVIVTFFTWVPNPDQGWVFFVLAALWGVGDAVWQTQINGNKIFVLEPSGIPIDPDPAGFKKPESEPKVRISNFGQKDPDSVQNRL